MLDSYIIGMETWLTPTGVVALALGLGGALVFLFSSSGGGRDD